MNYCYLCPRECGVDRRLKSGFCKMGENPVISKVMTHHWEEPPISGTKGSGTIFFTGCNLGCVYCQNHEISLERKGGTEISVFELCDKFYQLEEMGVHNINLVTGVHFAPAIIEAIKIVKKEGFTLPFVYNTSSYESIKTLKMLEGYIDIYLADIKYFSSELSEKYSKAPNYFNAASKAVLEMAHQRNENTYDENGIMQKGMLIRHLVLPSCRHDSLRILDWIKYNVPEIPVSLMAQYIPMNDKFKELSRKVTSFEYQSVVNYFFELNLKEGFMQDRNSAEEKYVPEF